jgi:hypothetical protein
MMQPKETTQILALFLAQKILIMPLISQISFFALMLHPARIDVSCMETSPNICLEIAYDRIAPCKDRDVAKLNTSDGKHS